MKKIIFILLAITIIFSGCKTALNKNTGESEACYMARSMSNWNEKNKDKSVIKSILDQCSLSISYKRRLAIHNFCRVKNNRSSGQSYDGCRIMLLSGK